MTGLPSGIASSDRQAEALGAVRREVAVGGVQQRAQLGAIHVAVEHDDVEARRLPRAAGAPRRDRTRRW